MLGSDVTTPGRRAAYRGRVPLLRALALVPLVAVAAACGGTSTHRSASTPPASSPPASLSPSPRPAVYPLTGLPVVSAAVARRPALSVKIDNVGAALPQAGLNDADLVADVLVEGGLTRLLATFQSRDASQIGPIRSARPVDADLLRELGGGIFAYSGADKREIAPSKDHSTALLVSNDLDPRWFHRVTWKPAPHNVFSSTSLLYRAGRLLAPALRAPGQLFAYGPALTGSTAARGVLTRFSSQSSAAWTWNGTSYLRTQNGAPDRLANGKRVSTTNVVVLSVTWRPTRIIDDAGNADPYVIVIGSGPAWVLRDGVVTAGRWVRPSYKVPMKLLDAAGTEITLHPGRTWMELQPRPFRPVFS